MTDDARRDDRLNNLHLALFGNGRPEEGMAVRLARMDERQCFLERRIGRIERAAWLVVALIGAELAGRIFGVL